MSNTLEFPNNPKKIEEDNMYASLFILILSDDARKVVNYSVRVLDINKMYRVGGYDIGRTSEDIPITATRKVSREQGHILYDPVGGKVKYTNKSENVMAYKNESLIKNGIAVALNDEDVIRFGECCYIFYIRTKLSEKIFEAKINGKKFFTIGRYEKNDVVIPLTYVSSVHASVDEKNGKYVLTDNRSRNGTTYRAKRIRKVTLGVADSFSVADVFFVKYGDAFFYSEPRELNSGPGEVLISARIEKKEVSDDNTGKKRQLLKNINIDIKRGSLVAIIGGSGAGKSTLMNCLNGMDQSYDGKVLFDGVNIKTQRNFDKLSYLIGSVPQKTLIHDYLTVEEELKQAAKLRRIYDASRKEIDEAVKSVITHDIKLDYKEDSKKRNSRLSGGQKRRVSIGMELVAARQVLCLDEPDAGLDPLTKKQLFEMLQKLTREKNLTILVIIHDVSHMNLFDQVIILGRKNNEGRLVASCYERDLLTNLGAKNYLEVYETIENNIEKYVKD